MQHQVINKQITQEEKTNKLFSRKLYLHKFSIKQESNLKEFNF